MRKYIIGMMASVSLIAVPPVYAQATPAPTTAPGASDEQCEDNSYVPVYEVANDGKSDSLAEAGTGETNKDAIEKKAVADTTPRTPRPPVVSGGGSVNSPVPVAGSNRTVGGQPIVAKNNGVNTASLTTQMRTIMDDIYATARRMGMPTPVVTSGNDSGHMAGSKHYSGNAVDLRCNGAYASASRCQAYANELARVLGSKYDVIFETFPNNPSNNHIHIEYDPRG